MSETIVDTFVFKSVRTPSQNKYLHAFEFDLYDMVRNTEFKRASSEFQSNLSKEIKRINEYRLLFIPTDGTNKLYKLSKENYNKLLTSNITKLYKKTNTAIINNININIEVKCIAERLHLDDRVEQCNQRESFVTLKDRK